MIKISIPGREDLVITHVAFDYNGTIAVDGFLPESLKPKLTELAKHVEVAVLTADTYGNVRSQCEGLPVQVCTFDRPGAAACKREIVEGFGKQVCTVGNGFNDQEMFEKSVLSIAILGREGAFGKLLMAADLVVASPEDAIDLLLNPGRIKAGLRT